MRAEHLGRVLGVVLLFAAACSEKAERLGPPPHPVRGRVTYQGKPAGGFRVTLYPSAEFEKARFAPAAVTDADGRFHIASYQADDGAPVGDYAVTFTWPERLNTLEDDSGVPEVDRLHGRYADPRKSQFRVTVREGENELPAFALE